VSCANSSLRRPEKIRENFSFPASLGGRWPGLGGLSALIFTSARATLIVLPDSPRMRKGVFNWPARAEQEISARERFLQKGAIDPATTPVGAAKAAARRAEQSKKNFLRVNVIGSRLGIWLVISRFNRFRTLQRCYSNTFCARGQLILFMFVAYFAFFWICAWVLGMMVDV
jgi:hypothetical protein